MAHGIVFRRIGGRVIPIKSQNDQHNVAKGAALVGAGAGVAYATGSVASGLMHESAHIENAARATSFKVSSKMTKAVHQGPLFVHAATQSTAKARNIIDKSLKMSRKIEQTSFRVRHVGTAAAATLIGLGVHKALSGTELEKSPKTKAAVATGAGVGAAFVVRSSYLRGVGMRGAKVLSHAARRAFLKI